MVAGAAVITADGAAYEVAAATAEGVAVEEGVITAEGAAIADVVAIAEEDEASGEADATNS